MQWWSFPGTQILFSSSSWKTNKPYFPCLCETFSFFTVNFFSESPASFCSSPVWLPLKCCLESAYLEVPCWPCTHTASLGSHEWCSTVLVIPSPRNTLKMFQTELTAAAGFTYTYIMFIYPNGTVSVSQHLFSLTIVQSHRAVWNLCYSTLASTPQPSSPYPSFLELSTHTVHMTHPDDSPPHPDSLPSPTHSHIFVLSPLANLDRETQKGAGIVRRSWKSVASRHLHVLCKFPLDQAQKY